MGQLLNEIKIVPGEIVSFQGKAFEIKQLTGGLKTVVLEDTLTGKLITAEIRFLQPANAVTADAKDSIPHNPIELISDDDWVIAQKRLSIIRPIIENRGDGNLVKQIAQENNIGIATLYRWIERYETTGQITSLLKDRPDGGKGKSRLTPDIDAIIKSAIDEIYLSKQRNPIKKVCHEVVRRCKNLKVTPPHINTIRNRILSISEEEQMRHRIGKKASDDKFKPTIGHFPNVDYPLAVVQIDHTPLDIILVDEKYRQPLGKPWITLAIDIYSRMIVGLYISFDTPGFLGTGMCIASTLLPKEAWLNRLEIEGEWPCWGKMNTLHIDNAKEFRGTMLAKSCEEYGINIEWRPVRTPNWGGHIERLLGTLLKEIHTLPGTTFSNPKQRGEYKSEAKAAFTLLEFEKWLITFIVTIYHQRIHTSLGTTPQKKFEEGLYQKTGLPPRIFNETKVKLDFLPFYERTIQEYGIIIDHIHYYGDVLRKWIHALEINTSKSKQKRKFIFKRDPRDISTVFFYDPDVKEYFKIPYRDTSRPPMTLWEYKEIVNRLTNSGAVQIDENDIFEAYEKLKEIEKQAVTKTQKAKRIKKEAKTLNSMQKSLKQELSADDVPNNGLTKIEKRTSAPRLDFKNIKPFDELEA